MGNNCERLTSSEKQRIRQELEKAHEVAVNKYFEIQNNLESDLYENASSHWSESQSELYDDRDALRTALENEPLWNPTDAQIEGDLCTVSRALEDLLRFAKSYCNVYALVQYLTERLRTVQDASPHPASTPPHQTPLPPALNPDLQLAAMLGNDNAIEQLQEGGSSDKLPTSHSPEEWCKAIGEHEIMGSVRLALVLVRLTEEPFAKAYPDKIEGFRNIRSGIEDWIACPCDLHAERLDNLWSSAKEMGKASRYYRDSGKEGEVFAAATGTLLTSIAFISHMQRTIRWRGHRGVSKEIFTSSVAHFVTMPASALESCITARSLGLGLTHEKAAAKIVEEIGREVIPWAMGQGDPVAARCKCSSCGASWATGEFTLGCTQCGGGALLLPCPECNGTCGSTRIRFTEASRKDNKAYWTSYPSCKNSR